jgi:arginyl-tRNA synthetase
MSELPTDPRADAAAPTQSVQTTPLEGLRRAVIEASEQLAREGGPAREDDGGGAVQAPAKRAGRGAITLEHPRRPEFGDYATNAALLLAPRLGAPPREIAERLGLALRERLGPELERFEVAGPGFVNLFLADAWLRRALAQVLAAGELFGAGGAEHPQRVLIEFVSANPTGPMHVGHARNAAYGDSLARMLERHGHQVGREFYVNDQGSQVSKFGESILAIAHGKEPPEDGYRGDYMVSLVARLGDVQELEPMQAGRLAMASMIEGMHASLRAFRVGDFGEWFRESSLHEGDPSPVAHTLAILAEHGHTYTDEGALWLRTTDFGDDKDRVLLRSNGEHTYFASDIAYHQHKRERGFERQIDVWGADHHGYLLRMKAAYAALGGDPDELELVIMQLVHLLRAGERAQMSKRAGEFVTLEELVAEIGVDAARWYLLTRSHDTTVDLDLDLAREQSKENPVYYVQYAHARIASMLAKAGEARVREASAAVAAGDGGAGSESGAGNDDGAALQPAERMLVEQLLAFPGELAEAVERRAPHRIATYVLELAQGFTAFYGDCRVLGAEPEQVESLRLALCLASMRTIATCLALLGVHAPEQM